MSFFRAITCSTFLSLGWLDNNSSCTSLVDSALLATESSLLLGSNLETSRDRVLVSEFDDSVAVG